MFERILIPLDGSPRAERAEGVKATGISATGDPASEIVDRASSLGTDAIAVVTRGRSGLSRWILGSVAEKVVRASPVPVLVVRSRGDQADR